MSMKFFTPASDPCHNLAGTTVVSETGGTTVLMPMPLRWNELRTRARMRSPLARGAGASQLEFTAAPW